MKTTSTAFLAVVLLLTVACSQPPEKKAAEQPPVTRPVTQPAGQHEENVLRMPQSMLRDLRITIATVEQRSGGEGAAVLGELQVNENAYAEVGSPIPSRVVRIHVAPGQFVKAGQPLATLQSPEVGKARSDILAAAARLELATSKLERKRRLGAERIVAQREIQEAEADRSSAQAELRAARTAVRALGVPHSEQDVPHSDSPQFTLRTPVGGVVIERAAVQGQMADPARPLFRVGDLSRLWLVVHAFERDAVRLRVGTPARVSLPALPGQAFTGKVVLIGKQVEADSRTIPVRIELSNKDGLLRPGMSASAWLTVAESGTVLAVPAAALQRVEGSWMVFIPRSEGDFEMRAVGRGRDLGGEVEIVSGLKPGEKVVVDGAFLFKAQAERAHGEGEHHDH
jgi:cobalt-zinc-cadmium efflux system membrane fusion protein